VYQSPVTLQKLRTVAQKVCLRQGIENEAQDVMQDAFEAVRSKLCTGDVTYQGQVKLVSLLHRNVYYVAQDQARRLRRMVATPQEDLEQHVGHLNTEADYQAACNQIQAASKKLPGPQRKSVETQLANETLPGSHMVPPPNHRSNLEKARQSMRQNDFPHA
jgi:DNA-directed RNA polymerase specialized sigma24 family protein